MLIPYPELWVFFVSVKRSRETSKRLSNEIVTYLYAFGNEQIKTGYNVTVSCIIKLILCLMGIVKVINGTNNRTLTDRNMFSLVLQYSIEFAIALASLSNVVSQYKLTTALFQSVLRAVLVY